jgi:Kef-type K+ transport system membrane component KefB
MFTGAEEILNRLEQVSVLVLLPVFFVVSGLSVNLSSVGLSRLVERCLILRPCGRGGRAGPPLS